MVHSIKGAFAPVLEGSGCVDRLADRRIWAEGKFGELRSGVYGFRPNMSVRVQVGRILHTT